MGATRDAGSGLTLLGARYYDPVTGCFISVDPILNLEVPAHLHAYAYGFNNPVTFSDASGLEPRDQNGNFDGDPYSSPSTTSWAYLNGCGGNLSCVGTWVGNFQLSFYGGIIENLWGLVVVGLCSICPYIPSTIEIFSDPAGHVARSQAAAEEFWSDPGGSTGRAWNDFWRPFGEDFLNNPGHFSGGALFTATTLVVPGGALIKAGSVAGKLGRVGAASTGGSATAVAVNVVDDATDLVRVGRWMSQKELTNMRSTGLVQEGSDGRTYVTYPPDPDAYLAGRGVFVEFDVPASSLRPALGAPGHAVIPGPNVTSTRYGPAPTEMPPATCIKVVCER